MLACANLFCKTELNFPTEGFVLTVYEIARRYGCLAHPTI